MFDVFKSGKICLFVGMDVVVCGIDVDDVMYVFNYDLLNELEVYVYCIGCMGCGGCVGIVIVFCDSFECG